MATDTATHVIQAATQAEYEAAVAQLDAYTADARTPPLQSRVDDAGQMRIAFVQVASVNLDN